NTPEESDYAGRTSQIAVRAKGLTNPVVIPVFQESPKGLIAENTLYEVGAEGGNITVEFQTNIDITATPNVDWITKVETRALESRQMTFAVAANEGYEPRTGTITLSGEGVEDEVLTVNQAETGLVTVSKEVEPIAAEGGSFSVDVRANVTFEVEIDEECDWIQVADTRAVVDTEVNFTVAKNEAPEARSANIYFISELGTDTITVNQEGNKNAVVTFANETFKKFLRKRKLDLNNDSEFSVSELEAITELTLWNRVKSSYYTFQTDAIADLSDLQYLPNLEYLDIQGVPAGLKSIDLSKNTKLRSLNCANTAITAIDLSNNTELEELNLSATKISSIDLSKNTKLKKLHIGGCLQLTTLDVSALTELTMLNCAYANITQLNVTNNTKLVALYCSGNQLTELNVSTLATLERLICDDNKLTSLDASANSQLKVLTCTRNQLTSINVGGLANLNRLAVSQNPSLATLSIAGNTALNFLHAAYTALATIDCSPAPSLWMLNANNSQLTKVGIESNTALRGLRVNNNALASLDITNNDLRYLWADGNSTLLKITVSDDFSPTTAITFFKDAATKWEGGKRPTYLDLSANGTANCYIINEAGQNYKFKATVKGNGYDPITGAEAETIAPTQAYILWGMRKSD
ncbi:MAG: hypothetical protein J6R31_00875, partial [Rikenellaceae bacterium]|nr:hypothetical protein [Rikenellaceae bacterium]